MNTASLTIPAAVEAPERPAPSLADIEALIHTEMQAVNRRITTRLHSEVALIKHMSSYLIHSGGKRVRPMTVLLSARACDYRGDDHIALATVIEFIHTATLLHDDVVDSSAMRRGQASANHIWGNEASVLVGDFLYSRAFEMMVEVGNMAVMEVMAKTTNTIAEGEVLQLMNCHSPAVTEAQYLDTIQRKTAKLFESAAQLGAVLANQPPAMERAMTAYGLHLGTAFQLVDDVLDYTGSSDDIGKNVGDDLAEGKPTLPLINALQHGTNSQQKLVRDAIKRGGRDHIDELLATIESTGALAYTAHSARTQAHQAKQALAPVPGSPHKRALLDLADFVVDRTY